jgi:hypothetical protein
VVDGEVEQAVRGEEAQGGEPIAATASTRSKASRSSSWVRCRTGGGLDPPWPDHRSVGLPPVVDLTSPSSDSSIASPFCDANPLAKPPVDRPNPAGTVSSLGQKVPAPVADDMGYDDTTIQWLRGRGPSSRSGRLRAVTLSATKVTEVTDVTSRSA